MEHELLQLKPEQIEESKKLKMQIANYRHMLTEFDTNIAKQREEMFQFSIEELYFMYGQYENRFFAIEFHENSDSSKKYGRNIGGTIIYTKSEREALDDSIKSGTVPRTNGIVKFDPTNNYNLPEELKDQLRKDGFMSGDIYEIMAHNSPQQRSFREEGVKEIPNTHTIELNMTNLDPHKMCLWVLSQRFNDGGILIDAEWNQFCAYSMHYKPESRDLDFIKERGFDANGNKKKEVRFYELNAKIFNMDVTPEETHEFAELLVERSKARIEIIREELTKSTNKSLEKFGEEYPKIYKEIRGRATVFEDETLECYETIIPIYWDFKSYLHIYLRHCSELQIEGHFKKKTQFQYSYKDIKRVLKIAIEKLASQINTRLKEGKDYRVWGDHSLYFNGNFYGLRIEPNGRVNAFYPIE